MRAKDIPPHLHERYGIRPPSPYRWVAIAAAVLVAAPTAIYAASRYVATQQVPFALISWASLDEQHAQVIWELEASSEQRWCVVRAQDFDHFDVGFAVVPVRAGVTRMEYGLATREHPLAVDITACETDVYSLPGPQFPPGVLPPQQVAPGLTPGLYPELAIAAAR